MAATTTSVPSGLALNSSIETLIDLDSQVEYRKQERKIRQQERERKRVEELRKMEEEMSEDQIAALAMEPQPSQSKSGERLHKLEMELEEMRRMRRSRRTSYTQEASKDVMPSQTISTDKKKATALTHTKEDVKESSKPAEKPSVFDNIRQQMKEGDKAPKVRVSISSGIVAKAKENFGKEDEKYPVFSKARQQEINIPVGKEIVGIEMKVDTERVPATATATEVTQKIQEQNTALSSSSSKEVPKKSVLSRYTIANEASTAKSTQNTRPPIRPIRTMTSLAERAAIFKEVKQPESISPVLNKRKSTPILNFSKKDEEEEDDSNISPSVCVSHRFGQPPQVISRKAWPSDESESSKKSIKRNLISALQNHPTAKQQVTKVVTKDEGKPRAPVQSKYETLVSNFPVEIQHAAPLKHSDNTKSASNVPQDLMTRVSPPLKSARKPTSPKTRKSNKKPTEIPYAPEPVEEVEEEMTVTAEPEAIQPIVDEQIVVQVVKDKVSSPSKVEEELGHAFVPKVTGNTLSKQDADTSSSTCPTECAVAPAVKQAQDRKNLEENEADAIRARILAKRMSSSVLDSKERMSAATRSSKPAEDDIPQFIQIRANLGRKGTETFRNATERKVEQRGGPLNITTYKWSTSSMPLTSTSESKPLPKLVAKEVTDSHRPPLNVLPKTSKSASIISTTSKVEINVQSKVTEKVTPKLEIKVEPMTEPKTEPKTELNVTPNTEPKIKPKVQPKVKAMIDDRNNVEDRIARKSLPTPLATKSSHQINDKEKSEKPVKTAYQQTREQFKRHPTEFTPIQKQEARPTPPSGRASLKKRAYSVSDLKAIHKKFEQAEQFDKPSPVQRPVAREVVPKEITPKAMEMPKPVKIVPDFIQARVSNLQIVSPTPRKLSPEPYALSAEPSQRALPITSATPDHSPALEQATSSSNGAQERNWRVRKELPFKLDMAQCSQPQSSVPQEHNSRFEPADYSGKKPQDSTMYEDIAQYDEIISISRRRASMPAPESYLREAINRSPAGSDDSSLLDTPKEGKKVSFSPTITTFRLDPVDEYEDANRDYFGSASKSSKLLDSPYGDLDQVPMSQLPPPVSSEQSMSRHQRTMSAPQNGLKHDNNYDINHLADKRDTSAFWKAFSSEMTNAPHIYGPSGRERYVSMLPQPDRPDSYYADLNRNERKPPAWVKNSLEGGRPEPIAPPATSWRQSGLWENLFGRKNNDKL